MADQREREGNPEPNPRAELAHTLLKAIRNKNKRRAHELIKKGADVNYTFDDGKTLLLNAVSYHIMYAVLHNRPKLVIELLKAGADVNKTDNEGKTALVYAALHNRPELVDELLEAGADVNKTDVQGRTALMYTAQKEKLQMLYHLDSDDEPVANKVVLTMLTEAGADVNITDIKGMTALMFALQSNKPSLVDELLEAGADVNQTDNEGRTGLMYAVLHSRPELVPKLLEAGANVNQTDREGKTVLMYVTEKVYQWKNEDHEDVLHILIQGGADVNKADNQGRTALMYAAKGNKQQLYWNDENVNVLKILIDAGADVSVTDNKGKAALNYSLENDKKHLACTLIDNGADVNVIDRHAKAELLSYSSRIGNESVVQEIIKAGININVKDDEGKTALVHALKHNKKSVASALLDAGADHSVIDKDGKSALFFAAISGNESVIQRLIKAGADLNTTDNQGKTALMYAIEHYERIACALLAAGADHSVTDKDGKSALFFAVIHGNESMVQRLIKAGADLNMKDNQGKTALMYAFEHYESIVAWELLDAGADHSIIDNDGKSALFFAAIRGNESVVQRLIKAGADLNITDNQGKTALMYAIQVNKESVACVLLDAGADHSVIDNDGKSALFFATISGNVSVVQRLIKAGADLNITDNQGKTALIHAVQNGRVNVVTELMDAGANTDMADNGGNTVLIHCVNSDKKGHSYYYGFEENNMRDSIILKLVEANTDLNVTNDRGKTALMYALEHDKRSIACALLDAGADHSVIDNDGKSALFFATISGNVSVVQRLIKAGADLNTADNQGMTALTCAVLHGKDKIATELIEAGADVNATDNKGNTALVYCAQNYSKIPLRYSSLRYNVHSDIFNSSAPESIACELVKAGADVDVTDDRGKTPLMYAVEYKKKKLTNALIEARADVNVSDNNGKTALIYSLQNHEHDKQEILALIKAGADVNISDHEGRTALFYGLAHGDITRALIEEGHAIVNKRDRYGRSVLFYSLIGSLTVTNYLLDKGGGLNMKDNCSMNIISFFVEHLMNEGKMNWENMSKLNSLQKKRIHPQTVFEAILNSVFCKIFYCMVQCSERIIIREKRKIIQALALANQYGAEQSVQEKQIIEDALIRVKEGNLSNVIELLLELGANPNYVDRHGNTALHYATCLPLIGTYEVPVVIMICQKLEDLGVSFIAKNHNNETPLLFCLSKKEWIKNFTQSSSKIKNLVEVCKFLLRGGSSVEETTRSGKTIFHLILELFQEGLLLNDEKIAEEALADTMKLLELFASSRLSTEITVNKRDAHLNSPLHLWAMLELHLSSKRDSNIEHDTFKKNLLGTIFKHLLACRVKLNDRNKTDETPLHICRSWTAVKLLIDAGANPKVLDSEGCSPLLFASKRISVKGNDHLYYEDVLQEPKVFWKTALDHNLDPWAVDNHGASVLSILIQEEAFDFSKALVEAACEGNYIQSDTIAVSLLNAVCQDSSTRKQWKSILVEMILKSRKAKLISFARNKDTPLHLCCRNIVGTSEEVLSNVEKILYYDKTITSVNSAKTSVHWTIAKQLLSYGMDVNVLDDSGQSCSDIAKKCPALKSLMLKPLDIDEVPLAFPWTSISTVYKPILSKVARQQECKQIDSYWYHETKIQKGSFGLVFAGMNEDGREVAIKRIEKLFNQLELGADREEIKNLIGLADCEQVVRYLSFTEDEHFCYVILELMEGNLNEYLDGDAFDSTRSVQLCGDVLSGLTYLHQQNILHRDLKPSNILFKTYPKLCLKIADFGLSRQIDTLGTYTTSIGSVVGTRCWIAPEVLKCSSKKTKHQKACDVFSAGLVIHYILSGKKHPFTPADCTDKSELQISNETEANVIKGKMEGLGDALSPEATNLVQIMLDSDPLKRPTAAMTLKHPFFWSKKKKMDFLSSVGNQPDFEYSRAKKHKEALPFTSVEYELDGKLKRIIMAHPTWDDTNYVHMPAIYKEMTKRRSYDTSSVVELVRFIRNTLAHISEDKRPTLIRKLVLEDFVFLEYFPNLVMEVFKCVKMHGWDSREEIKYHLS